MNRLGVALFALVLASCGSETQTTASGSGSGAKTKPSATASNKATAKTSASASTSTSTSTSASGPSASASSDTPDGDEKKGKMANCPNAAPNAKTTFKDVDKGVEITVTATDKKDVDEIRARAKDIDERAKGESTKAPHSGQGGGGGAQGRCPVVMNGTKVTVAETEGGSKFTVLAKDDKEVEWLRREAKERLAAMSEPGADAAGEGKMANCPSAVKGGKTAVKEDKGNIVVTITSKDEAAVKDIRERAKKLAAMKHENPKKGEHGGKGAGAEGGRCPAVLEGTTAEAKDVEGGTEITLKPKTPGDSKKLLKEAQDRAARFD